MNKKPRKKITGWTAVIHRHNVLLFVTVKARDRHDAVNKLELAGFSICREDQVRPTTIVPGHLWPEWENVPELDENLCGPITQ